MACFALREAQGRRGDRDAALGVTDRVAVGEGVRLGCVAGCGRQRKGRGGGGGGLQAAAGFVRPQRICTAATGCTAATALFLFPKQQSHQKYQAGLNRISRIEARKSDYKVLSCHCGSRREPLQRQNLADCGKHVLDPLPSS